MPNEQWKCSTRRWRPPSVTNAQRDLSARAERESVKARRESRPSAASHDTPRKENHPDPNTVRTHATGTPGREGPRRTGEAAAPRPFDRTLRFSCRCLHGPGTDGRGGGRKQESAPLAGEEASAAMATARGENSLCAVEEIVHLEGGLPPSSGRWCSWESSARPLRRRQVFPRTSSRLRFAADARGSDRKCS